MIRVLSSLVGVVLLTSAAPALAQEVGGLHETSETGTAMRRQAQNVEDRARINRYSKAVASCLHTRNEERSHRFLLNSDPSTVDLGAAGINIGRFNRQIEQCMGRRMHEFSSDVLLTRVGMSFSWNRLRALLLEEAYLSDHDGPPTISQEGSEIVDRNFVSSGDALVEAQGLARFSDCVIFSDTVAADALLRTEPGSDEEIDRARALAPTLGQCLIEGQQIQFTPASIRAIAADGLWARTVFGAASGGDGSFQ